MVSVQSSDVCVARWKATGAVRPGLQETDGHERNV